jgi:catechol 2,3-dioxygenase-like lactoylglutathione lyase family enzyme
MALDGSFFHVGVVVRDLEAAREHLRELLGVVWGPVVEIDIAKRDAAGNDLTLPLRVCYSTVAPRLELIEEIPGSVWECNEHSNLHHVGFWSDDLVADVGAFGAAGCPLLLSGRDGDVAPVQSAYHRDPLGFIVELVDTSNRALLEQSMFKPEGATRVQER